MSAGWPETMWLVRHGQSRGNVLRADAYASGAYEIALGCSDGEAELSPLGQSQATALGVWFAGLPPEQRPTVAVVSTYLRAQQTLDGVLAAAGIALPVRIDERLRDREQGILDLLTWDGIRARFPEEASRRALVGKFGYRPPGGESWADVALRLRAAMLDLRLDEAGERVLVVTHDVVVILSRFILTGLSVADAVRLSGEVANSSVTTYDASADGRAMTMRGWNSTAHLPDGGPTDPV